MVVQLLGSVLITLKENNEKLYIVKKEEKMW